MSGRSQQSLLAEGLARQGHVAPAVDACYQALRIDDADPIVHALLADLFLDGDFYDEAIRAASRAIEIDPDCAPAYLALGLAYDRRGGMWDQSILVWHELAEVAPDLVTAHVQLGEAFAAAAFSEEAIEAWRTALELDPTEARAMYNLAVAALKREGMATALPGFRKAGELDPSQDDFFFSLAGVYDDGTPAPDPNEVAPDRASRLAGALALAFEEDFFGAADLIRLILDEDADDAETLALAGYLYLKQEAVNEAMAVALRALAVSTKTPTAVYVLGASFHKRPGPEPQRRPRLRRAGPRGARRADAPRAPRRVASRPAALHRGQAGVPARRRARPHVRPRTLRARRRAADRGRARERILGDPPRRLPRHPPPGTLLAPLRRVRRGEGIAHAHTQRRPAPAPTAPRTRRAARSSASR